MPDSSPRKQRAVPCAAHSVRGFPDSASLHSQKRLRLPASPLRAVNPDCAPLLGSSDGRYISLAQQKNSMRDLFKILLIALSLSVANSAIPQTVEAKSVPIKAVITIEAVHAAASSGDYIKLRSLMTNDFLWSLGGDRDAEQAITAWKNGVGVMNLLSELTAHIEKCGFITPEHIQCPAELTDGWRAAFVNTPQGWRMSHFLAGD